jgi:uncharacterized protein (TIGR02147 family)
MKPIQEYLDYREALRDYFEERKTAMPLYSYRMLGNRMGMDSSQAFRVLKGELQLPQRGIKSCTEMLGLDSKGVEYFELLVHFARAKSDRERKMLFERILNLREAPEHMLTAKQYRFFAEWHISAVRALLGSSKYGDDWGQIAAALTPPITRKQAQENVALLCELGLVRKVGAYYELTENHIGTGRDVTSLAVRTFHHEMLRLADESLERHPKNQREFGTLTMAVDEVCYREITDLLAECRRQIRKRVDEVTAPDRVMQLNMQVFPLAFTGEKK